LYPIVVSSSQFGTHSVFTGFDIFEIEPKQKVESQRSGVRRGTLSEFFPLSRAPKVTQQASRRISSVAWNRTISSNECLSFPHLRDFARPFSCYLRSDSRFADLQPHEPGVLPQPKPILYLQEIRSDKSLNSQRINATFSGLERNNADELDRQSSSRLENWTELPELRELDNSCAVARSCLPNLHHLGC
jgi:hypothetical protein